jgi:hypothetical protein
MAPGQSASGCALLAGFAGLRWHTKRAAGLRWRTARLGV